MPALRKLAEECEYGAMLDDLLRDRFVSGINNGRILRRLLSESKLTYKKAFELAQAMESANKHAHDLQAVPATVHVVRSQPGGAPPKSKTSQCYRCGGKHQATVDSKKSTATTVARKDTWLVYAVAKLSR